MWPWLQDALSRQSLKIGKRKVKREEMGIINRTGGPIENLIRSVSADPLRVFRFAFTYQNPSLQCPWWTMSSAKFNSCKDVGRSIISLISGEKKITGNEEETNALNGEE